MTRPTLRARQALYFAYFRANGRSLGRVYRRFRDEDRARIAADHIDERLRALLRHAGSSVPYYAELLRDSRGALEENPTGALRELPVLTKDTIRDHFEELRSQDGAQRRTYPQTSGGSTGEPVRFMQDFDYLDRVVAVQILYSTWAGREPGEPEFLVWGDERDLLQGSVGFRTKIANRLMGRKFLNAFRMSQEAMRDVVEQLSENPPKLIVAYAQALDDLASFAVAERIPVTRQRAIVSTAGTLVPDMRDRIERVFGCPVFDRYGSREVGDIAGECAHHRGLHVFPWTNFVEVVDEQGKPVEPGMEGRILVTSLANYTMPLIRYEIGDRAKLLPVDEPPCKCGRGGQRIARILGRTVDTFKALDGSLINGEYFTHLLYFKDFVEKFQVVQRDRSTIVYRLVTSGEAPEEALDEIVRGTRTVIGPHCEVDFEFPDDIPPSPSGKYRYTISEC